MKKLLRIGMILAAGLIGLCGTNATQAQGTVSFQVFYDQLQPYGTWMNYGSYGYVWMPQVDRDFVPYGTNGYWVNTDYGNTWVSDYDWGWAPFHYGRWLYDDFYGWLWVPGNEWAPAWVAWRSGGGYYGWAPLMPGMGIGVSFSVYSGIPNHCWNFVPYQYITYRRVYAHCVPRPTVVNIIHQTTIVTYNHHDRHYAYFTGPSRREMEHDGRTRVPQYRVDSRNTPGHSEVGRGAVAIYRPQVQENTRHAAAPTRVVQEGDMRRHQETILSQHNRDDARERQREPEHRPAIQQEQRRETQRRDAEGFRRQQQENNPDSYRGQQQERFQEQRHDQQQERIRQQQIQRQQQENNVREQQRQQQERIQEQQHSQQREWARQQQVQQRQQQENAVREQQQRQQQERFQEQQRNQQQERVRQQEVQQRQQQQIREQQQQSHQRTPSQPNNGGGGGSQRRRQH